MCSQFKLSFQEWPDVLHIVQSDLNNVSPNKLRGNCPLTVFDSVPAGNPITIVLLKEKVESISWSCSKESKVSTYRSCSRLLLRCTRRFQHRPTVKRPIDNTIAEQM
jgi:hypothetical protein